VRKDEKEPEHEHQHASSSRGAIDINRGVYDSLLKKIDFEIFEKTGKDHPVWEIPSGNQQMVG